MFIKIYSGKFIASSTNKFLLGSNSSLWKKLKESNHLLLALSYKHYKLYPKYKSKSLKRKNKKLSLMKRLRRKKNLLRVNSLRMKIEAMRSRQNGLERKVEEENPKKIWKKVKLWRLKKMNLSKFLFKIQETHEAKLKRNSDDVTIQSSFLFSRDLVMIPILQTFNLSLFIFYQRIVVNN